MVDFKSTSQFVVSCKGASMPVVDKYEINPDNKDYVDLYLKNDPLRSQDVTSYSAKFKGMDLNVIKVRDNILTVEL